MRILFIAYQRIRILKNTLIFYGIAFFFFSIGLCVCQFRLIFVDPKVLKIYEKSYSELTGLFHYLPGKFEVFFLSLIFVPIWIIHFLFSSNLNSFFEDKTMEQKEEEEQAALTKQRENNFDIKFDKKDNQNPKSPMFRKNVIVTKLWKDLTKKEKILRTSIIFVPILLISGVNLGTQYFIAFMFEQGNFNLFNIMGNLVAMYFVTFHLAVFVPLMMMRAKVLMAGDYLWSPACNFIVDYHKDLDLEKLKDAQNEYDEKYLTLVAHGHDPNTNFSNFDIENGNMYWKKSKLGDFAKNGQDNYFSVSGDDAEEMDPNRTTTKSKTISPFKIKYTTFDANNESFPDKDDLKKRKDSNKSVVTNKTEQSVWTEDNDDELDIPDSPLTNQELGSQKPIPNMFKDNDFSDEEPDFGFDQQEKRESDEFEKMSPASEINPDEEILSKKEKKAERKNEEDNLDDYFTDIDNGVQSPKMASTGKLDDFDQSPILSENDDEYFNVNTDRQIDPNKK